MSLDLSVLEISYKWGHTIYGLSGLASSFTQRTMFKIHPCCSILIPMGVRVSISPHPHQSLSVFFFLITATLVGVKWYLFVVLICIPLMTNNVEIFPRAYWPFLYHIWKNVYSRPLPIVKPDYGGFFFFLLLNCKSSLRTFQDYQIRFANISSHSLGNLFIFLESFHARFQF